MFHGCNLVSDVRWFAFALVAFVPVAFLPVATLPVFADEVEPVSVYNQAIQRYQQSAFEEAAALFQQAATSPDDVLAASARYNLGNARYAAATRILQQQAKASLGDHSDVEIQDPALPPVPLRSKSEQGQAQSGDSAANPIDLLRQAVDAYRSCLRLSPDDDDARFNLENALRLIDQLTAEDPDSKSEKKNEKQQQSQPSEQNDEQGNQDADSGDPEQAPSQDQDSDPNQSPEDREQSESEQSESEQDESDPQESGEQDSESDADPSGDQDPSEGNEQETGSNSGDAQGQDDALNPSDIPPAQPNGEADGDAVQAGEAALTQQEASRLLQAIRDRDMQRRKWLEQIKRSRRIVVPRDW